MKDKSTLIVFLISFVIVLPIVQYLLHEPKNEEDTTYTIVKKEKMNNNIPRIIFLDIDGVMAGEEYFKKERKREGDTLFIDPSVVKLLNSLKDIPNIQIVISSSWGESAIGPLERLGIQIPITGITRHQYKDWVCRGSEIEEYIVNTLGYSGTKFGDKHNRGEYEYVIVDDDEDMLLGQRNHFVHIDSMIGLTEADIEKIREILATKTEKYQ